MISKQDVEKIHSYILMRMKKENIRIEEIYYCPHINEDNCECKKPKPFFINQAKEQYVINTARSFVIGDHPSDVQLAINSNAQGIYLLTGHGRKHFMELGCIRNKIKVFHNLKFATTAILNLAKENE